MNHLKKSVSSFSEVLAPGYFEGKIIGDMCIKSQIWVNTMFCRIAFLTETEQRNIFFITVAVIEMHLGFSCRYIYKWKRNRIWCKFYLFHYFSLKDKANIWYSLIKSGMLSIYLSFFLCENFKFRISENYNMVKMLIMLIIFTLNAIIS